MVLRDIHCSGVGRTRRMIRATTWCLGWRGLVNGAGQAGSRFLVNGECRPYHLGWILYAAALVYGAIKKRPSEKIDSTRSAAFMPCGCPPPMNGGALAGA
jgi:hypothetical protein